jgi:osmotically-inducible protein OsmY
MKKQVWLWVLLMALLPVLQGCFPIVAGGVVGTGFVVADRRTSGAQLEDEGIELRAANAISQKYGDKVHVNVNSYNRIALLTGEVPDQAARAGVENIARNTTNVRSVVNELVIAGNSSFADRAADSYLTSKVRTRFLSDSGGKFWPVHVSITSEAGVVYLMGLVTQSEGDAAAQIASTTSGVRRVVKVFEYIPHVPEGERPQPAQGEKAGATAQQAPAEKPVETQPPAPIETLPPAQPIKM